MDIEADTVHFKAQEGLLQKIRLEIGDSRFVFADEIQRKENAGIFLKGLYEGKTKVRFVPYYELLAADFKL